MSFGTSMLKGGIPMSDPANQANQFALLELMKDYLLAHGPEWGALHVVCADGNWEDEHLEEVARSAMMWQDGEPVKHSGEQLMDIDARNIARGLLKILPAQRKLRRDTAERMVSYLHYVRSGFPSGSFVPLTGGTLDVVSFDDDGLSVGHAEAPEGASDFSHDRVVGRFPKGTDPLAAIRETMGVFMERTDGTNALPWWLRERWWHGSHGGFRRTVPDRAVLLPRRDMLLPPSTSGVEPHLGNSDPDSVYVTRVRSDAIIYSAWHRNPMLYEVTFDLEPQPDDTLNDENSFRVPSARIHRIESVSHIELMAALNKVMAADDL
jgi:hypothetical protein